MSIFDPNMHVEITQHFFRVYVYDSNYTSLSFCKPFCWSFVAMGNLHLLYSSAVASNHPPNQSIMQTGQITLRLVHLNNIKIDGHLFDHIWKLIGSCNWIIRIFIKAHSFLRSSENHQIAKVWAERAWQLAAFLEIEMCSEV